MAVPTFTKTGTKSTTTVKLPNEVFGLTPKSHALIKEAYVAYMANGRRNLAATKTRGEVSGGGRKPWRQKGTGRARVGSSRTPVWRHGGIIFGPTGEENYTKRMTTKAKRQAIRQALSVAAANDKLIVIEDITIKDAKTAGLAKLLAKIGADRVVLLVVERKSDELSRAAANLPSVKVVQGGYLNVYDVMNADKIVVTNGSIASIVSWLGKPGAKATTTEAKHGS